MSTEPNTDEQPREPQSFAQLRSSLSETGPQVNSLKRPRSGATAKAEPECKLPLTDAKRQQLAEMRQKKQEKQELRNRELSELKSKLSDFEVKLKDTETKLQVTDQKVTNTEIDRQVHNDSEKKQKVVTAEPDVKPVENKTGYFENLLNPENVIKTGALVGLAGASFYFKNFWKRSNIEVPEFKPRQPPVASEARLKTPQADAPSDCLRQRAEPGPVQRYARNATPLSSMFPRV